MEQNSLKCNQCNCVFDKSTLLITHYMTEHPDSPEAIKINFTHIRRSWKKK